MGGDDMVFTNPIDWAALAWFALACVGYTFYTRRAAQEKETLSACLYAYRIDWMRNMLTHENRITDVALLGNLSGMVNFLATTTILILAGIVTMLSSTDRVISVLSGHDYIVPATRDEVQFKLMLLMVIFVFAFFKFTWSMRQHTFCNIMMGALPLVRPGEETEEHREMARYAAKVSDRAGHEFNSGLRCYYFALAALMWFLGPYVFIVGTALVVMILYRREFRSATLRYLQQGLAIRRGTGG